MKLHDDWKAILTKAWSMKFNALALGLGALEVYVGMVKPDGIPTGAFAMLSAIATTGAMVARVLAQKELSSGDK